MRNKKYFEMACKMEKQVTKRNTEILNSHQWLKQGLEPWVGESPYVLILGTLPSDVSIKSQAYYQNKSHNSFYKIMEHLFLYQYDSLPADGQADYLIEVAKRNLEK